MLPKKNRIGRRDINLLFKKGKSTGSPDLTFKFITFPNGRRFSFIVPKKIARLSVKRNKLRRYGYLALEKFIDHFPAGIIGVFIFKKYQDNTLKLEDEIKSVLNKIN